MSDLTSNIRKAVFPHPYKYGRRVTLGEDPVVGVVIEAMTNIAGMHRCRVQWPNGVVKTYSAYILDPAPEQTDSAPNKRAQTLATAETLINGERAKTYGEPQENFGRIANLWNAQFGHKIREKFTATDVALALTHLKLSRLAVTPGHADSWIDAVGYLGLGSEVAGIE